MEEDASVSLIYTAKTAGKIQMFSKDHGCNKISAFWGYQVSMEVICQKKMFFSAPGARWTLQEF